DHRQAVGVGRAGASVLAWAAGAAAVDVGLVAIADAIATRACGGVGPAAVGERGRASEVTHGVRERDALARREEEQDSGDRAHRGYSAQRPAPSGNRARAPRAASTNRPAGKRAR